jgi:hypothetical protein
MDFQIVNIFPTTIYVGRSENHEKHKESFYNVYSKFDYPQINQKTNTINTVSENCGNPLLHLEESLDSLFNEIVKHIKNYVHDVLLVKDILASKIGDIIAEKVSASQYENKILLYKDEDWGYITDAQRFNEIVNNEIAEWVNNDYEKTIKYKGKYLKTFILIEGTYKLELNKDPLFLEFQNEVEKRKKYYIDNILKLLKQSHNLTITIKANSQWFCL